MHVIPDLGLQGVRSEDWITPPELIFGALGLVILTTYVTELVRYQFGSNQGDPVIADGASPGGPSSTVFLNSPCEASVTR